MKKNRIVKTQQDFNKIIKTGKKIYNNAYVIYYKVNNLKFPRYGISVGTKIGNAVCRNKYKRRIRMIVTINKNILEKTSNDYIIILRKNGIHFSYQELEQKYVELANKIREV